VVGSREELATERVEVRDAVLHRDGARVDRVRLRYHSRALACRMPDAGPGPHDALELELDEPASGVAPGQTACLLDGDLVVGHGTIHSALGVPEPAAAAPRLTPA
jgi:tRNA-specific 2-thiouridylase